MTWEICLGIFALVGFGISINAPLMKLNTSITNLNALVDTLKCAVDRIDSENQKSHERLWTHNEEQNDNLSDHEQRITKIETKIDILHPESKGA